MTRYTVYIPTGLTRLDTDDAKEALKAGCGFIGNTLQTHKGAAICSPDGAKAFFVIDHGPTDGE